jgi:hypothetical protein
MTLNCLERKINKKIETMMDEFIFIEKNNNYLSDDAKEKAMEFEHDIKGLKREYLGRLALLCDCYDEDLMRLYNQL